MGVWGREEERKSSLYAELAIGRLRQHGKENFELLSYPGAGHRIDPPSTPFCQVALDDPANPANSSCTIPIEKAEGHFLLVVGEADRMWKSSLYAELAIGRSTPAWERKL